MKLVEYKTVEEVKEGLHSLGCEEAGVSIMAPKFVFRTIKVGGISPKAAHIIKQQMLAAGGEAAVPIKAWNFENEKVDIIIAGTLKQLAHVIEKTPGQPFGVPEIGQKVLEAISSSR